MLKIDLRNEGNEYYIKKYQKDDFNEEMIFFSRMSMLDWAGVAYAGRIEPVSQIVT